MVNPLSVCLHNDCLIAELGSVILGNSVETFAGPYSVESLAAAQSLLTKGKLMSDNVNIKAVSLSRISNAAGGKTVNIGGID